MLQKLEVPGCEVRFDREERGWRGFLLLRNPTALNGTVGPPGSGTIGSCGAAAALARGIGHSPGNDGDQPRGSLRTNTMEVRVRLTEPSDPAK